MPLVAHGPDLWTFDHQQRIGLMTMPARGTVVRLTNGALLLHSPGPLDDGLAADIAALGDVAYIVAPSPLHDAHLAGAARRFPSAATFGPRKLVARRDDVQHVLEGRLPWDGDGLHTEPLRGMDRLNETVFFHEASRTLIVTDLVMNVHEGSALLWFLMALEGCWKRPAIPRIVPLVLTTDRAAAAHSAARLLEWAPERLVMGHGEVVESGATALLARDLRGLAPEVASRALATVS